MEKRQRNGVLSNLLFLLSYIYVQRYDSADFAKNVFFTQLASCTVHSDLGCSRNEKKIFLIRTETNRNKICFGCVSVCFVKPKTKIYGLFRCFEHISKQPKQKFFGFHETNRNKRETDLVSVCFGSNRNYFFSFRGHPTRNSSTDGDV